ncbi:hypothetical protein PHLGIDRAFT_63457 [Phlebiopsis gigantea 11061_1 CR5-6]|uniref:RhoGAP-domain-containing protein n=1 Tax=Phlebiopsis gigantea (strain 11061_1 CR5-6) TaxID=745531 RepID=A0A0C3PV28_PHLG1|nr:hypothetical protein PHLGIDRAFT_63457 [Phlebiopsis gigantea 11061_1 CR5-6]
MAQNMIPDPSVLGENRTCPGCKNSVVTENGGVVVAFGQSYFHIDCFKCAKCHQQVTADTNLLLLSDGSPVCANCSYCCNVCGQPILDEAIMTGDDSYHAHCFNCKVCKKRIEELVFAKTSQGIYCMPCHSERVARSRRHLEKKERERREREKQMVGLSQALSKDTPVIYRTTSPTPDHTRSTSIPLTNAEMLSVPIATSHQQALQKRRSSDDRPVNMLVDGSGEPSTSSQGGLLSPDSGTTSRRAKRQSINPGLVVSFNNFAEPPQRSRSPSTPSTPHAPYVNGTGTPNGGSALSPLRDRFEVKLSPPGFTHADGRHSPHPAGRSRSASSSDTQPPSRSSVQQRDRSKSPMRRRTPQLNEGRASPSLNVPNGATSMLRQMSLDSRKRTSTSSLGQTLDLPPRSPSAGPTSPSHRIDVPQGVESGTDTETEVEEDLASESATLRDSLPPLPPPKETKGTRVGMRPPQLKLDSSHIRNGSTEERDDLSQVDSAEVSEEYLQEEEPIESTSHSTFIAPALPPIRFSMVGTDFADLLNSVGGPDALKQIDRIIEGEDGSSSPDVTATPPPTAVQPTTPTNNGFKVDINADATPVRRREPPITHSQSPQPMAVYRPRNGSTASLAPFNGSTDRFIPRTHITITAPENGNAGVSRPDTSDLARRRLHEALSESTDRGAPYVKLDAEFIGAIILLLDQRKEEFLDLKRKLDGMKRASQQYVEGLTVAQTEYDKELRLRREAEAEVTRLRVLLSSQAVRLKAISGETKKQEAQKQLSQELSDSLSTLERDLSKLKLERDMALAEVEELSISKSLASDRGEETQRLSRALSVRFDNIKNQYQSDLLPLTAQREAMLREITELRASRDAYLEETTMLSARNEELAQLHSQYLRRLETVSDSSHEMQREPSLDKGRPMNLSSSVTSSTTAFSEESGDSRFIKVSKPDALETMPQPRAKFMKWPGSRSQPQSSKENHAPTMAEQGRAKPRIEHNFQQVNGLRVARCDHCGDKMWGSIMRCGACNISVHHRCLQQVHLPCSQHAVGHKNEMSPPPQAGPSMFGRELIEQVRADSKDEERLVPVIVEKCIDAVDTLALDYEGIYRKTGGSGQSKIITQLFERGDYASFDLRDSDRFNDICSVTSVLKTYFRSLPDPLLTYQLHDKFIEAASIKDPAVKGARLNELIAELPAEHYHTTRALMLHLHRVCKRSDKNLMHARNLGVVFGPTLMRSRDPNAEFSDMAGKALSVEWLVENAPIVFEQGNASS